MNTGPDERVLAFLQGELDATAREEFLDQIERSPELAADVRAAAAGLEAIRAWGTVDSAAGQTTGSFDAAGTGTVEAAATGSVAATATRRAAPAEGRRIPASWLPLAVAATVAATIPATLALSEATPGTSVGATTSSFAPPQDSEPSFVVVLQGRWPDAAGVEPAEQRRRADEYWGWAEELARAGILVAAGDLRWEPGLRVAPGGSVLSVSDESVADPDFLVGMFAVRAGSYEEALRIAQRCPHLRYGGSVSVRQVAGGFVTVPGMDDWAG